MNLLGFLEGSREVPLRWSSTTLSAEPSPEEWRSIQYFRIRAREYLANVDDLGLGRRRTLSVNSGGERVAVSASSYPGRHRAKSLYLDFRHFVADREPSKFEKVVNLLRRHLRANEPLQKFLPKLKHEFANPQNGNIEVAGDKRPISELINIWFNTEFFHAGRADQMLERERWLKVMEDESVHHLMFWAVVGAAHEVKTLYACIKDLDQSGTRAVNCPDLRIIER